VLQAGNQKLRQCTHGGIGGEGEAPLVIEVELVLQRDLLLLDKHLLAHDHGVDEALRDRASRVRGVVLGLLGRRTGAVVENEALL